MLGTGLMPPEWPLEAVLRWQSPILVAIEYRGKRFNYRRLIYVTELRHQYRVLRLCSRRRNSALHRNESLR